MNCEASASSFPARSSRLGSRRNRLARVDRSPNAISASEYVGMPRLTNAARAICRAAQSEPGSIGHSGAVNEGDGPLVGLLILAPTMILARYVWSTAWNTAPEALIGLVIVGALIVVSRDEHSPTSADLGCPHMNEAASGNLCAWQRPCGSDAIPVR